MFGEWWIWTDLEWSGYNLSEKNTQFSWEGKKTVK
jgi:hypothetical protein